MTEKNSSTPLNSSGSDTDNPLKSPEGITRIETHLARGTIHDLEAMMRWGSNYAGLVSIEYENKQQEAVYKPQRGERPLWDFPTGTLCYREVLAYHISEALGWHLVPPTVLRTGPHGLGSFQLFVPHDPEIHYFTLNDSFEPQLQKYAAFDAIINNADRKGGHILLGKHGKLWGIDHGLTFHPAPKLRTVIWDFAEQAIPGDLLEDIAKLYLQMQDTNTPARQMMDELFHTNEIDALTARIQYLIDCCVFPQPGAGPSFPWPPV